MLFKPVQGPVLPQKELSNLELEKIVAQAEFPERGDLEKKYWNAEEWAKLEAAWRAFKGPVRDSHHFAVLVPYGFMDGDLELHSIIEYIDGDVFVDLIDDSDLLEKADLITTVEPTEQIKAVKKTAPNAKCGCKSGKKYKKCCGRFTSDEIKNNSAST